LLVDYRNRYKTYQWWRRERGRQWRRRGWEWGLKQRWR